MAVRVADSLKQQNDLKSFPVAYSEDIWLDQNKGEGDADYKDLQTLFNENKLGGSGLPLPEQANMVMISYEKEEGDLDWKQSLLKTVEKVDEVPTTFEDKVYIIEGLQDITNLPLYEYKFQGNPTPDFSEPEAIIQDFCNEHNITIKLKDYTTSRFYEFEFQDDNIIINSLTSTGELELKDVVSIEARYNGSYWGWSAVPRTGSSIISINSPIRLLCEKKEGSTKKIQVYASNVELATKEYADTHGAGAQVYTQAEWNALPVKPAPGTQVIISDDTSGGGAESIADAIKVLNVKVQNSEYANGMDLSDKVAAVMPEGYQFLTWTHVSSNGWVTEYPIYCSNAGNTKGFPWTATNNITGMPKESDKTISFFCLVVKK